MVDINNYDFGFNSNPTGEGKESWNTGSGYYFRLDQLLTEATKSRFNNDKIRWHVALVSIYLEVHAKCEPKEKMLLERKYDHFLDEFNTKGMNANSMIDSSFIDFEIYLREVMEEKGMLSPRRGELTSLA